MKKCDTCRDNVSMPYECSRCGYEFCSDHRLPENHNCPGLNRGGKKYEQITSELNNSNNLSNNNNYYLNKIRNKLDDITMWSTILGIMCITYVIQLLILFIFNEEIHNMLFVLSMDNIVYFWTIITSIFAHSPVNIIHIIGNAIILIFFGRILEKRIGTKSFTYLFLSAGIISGISQIILNSLLGTPNIGVLGASGALLGVLGALTIYNPNMKVYLYFILPIPLWFITIGYVLLSIIGVLSMGSIMGNVAHTAHLMGLIVGLAYGFKTKDKYYIPNEIKL